jgi:hypothetical protein
LPDHCLGLFATASAHGLRGNPATPCVAAGNPLCWLRLCTAGTPRIKLPFFADIFFPDPDAKWS